MKSWVLSLALGLAATVVWAAPVYEWRFDAEHVSADGSVTATSGGIDGVVSGETRIATSGFGALVFDGVANSVRMTGVAIEGPAFSVETWVLATSVEGSANIASTYDGYDGFTLARVLDRFTFSVGTSKRGAMAQATSREPLLADAWYYVVGTFDGARARIFVNGQEFGRLDEINDGSPGGPDMDLVIGGGLAGEEGRRLRGLIHELNIHDHAGSAGEMRGRMSSKRVTLPQPPREVFGPYLEIAGPFVEFVSRHAARVTWHTAEPMTSVVEAGPDAAHMHTYSDATMTTEHAVVVSDIVADRMHAFRIMGDAGDGDNLTTEAFEFDSTFNYTAHARRATHAFAEKQDEPELALASRVALAAPAGAGYCLVLGAGRGALAYGLAQQTDMQVIVVDPDPGRVAAAREALDDAGVYGDGVSVMRADYDALPFGPYFANVVVSATADGGSASPAAAEVYRVLRPYGGLAYVGGDDASRADLTTWLGKAGITPSDDEWDVADGVYWTHSRPALPGAGEWSHQYGSANNTACSEDELLRGDVDVLWFGRPGPRPMPDRGPRNPAPLSTDGRLFVQGNRVFFGMDAYNGAVLWSFQAPHIRRSNMPRASSNQTAADDYLYLAAGPHCYGINAQTGARDILFTIPEREYQGVEMAWGYVGVVGDTLLASATPVGGDYLGDQGEWFEGDSQSDVGKVTSEYMFAFDRHTGEELWRYDHGVIVNSTIAVQGDSVYFVETRDAAHKPNGAGRLADLPGDLRITAISLAAGAEEW
ncbi:methyltransferase domain-containing protein, partial [Candidatus Poribacteria bacterium]|nr:methyltransferase domain-containing protein [Candidatus Poribacteria bacterium]